MAVLCASVKRAELLEPGDAVNILGIGVQVDCVEVDELEGVVNFHAGGLQHSYALGRHVEYVTAEQWENA